MYFSILKEVFGFPSGSKNKPILGEGSDVYVWNEIILSR